MKFVDLTQTLAEDMPLFPGTPAPKFNVKYRVETDGFRELEITLYSHTGTHLDTPAHVFGQGKTLEDYGVDQFSGAGLVLDCRQLQGEKITLEIFKQILRKNSNVKAVADKKELFDGVDYLFFYTGWDQKWGSKEYFTGAPSLSKEVAEHLTSLNLKGIGIDALSVDPMTEDQLSAHRILLGKGVIIVENLKNLGNLLDQDFEFYGFPLKIQGGEGSPIRGVAKIP